MPLTDRIIVDPNILTGKPVVRVTRIAVEFVVELLALGWSHAQILASYPYLTDEDVRTCVDYASELLREERRDLERKPALNRMTTTRSSPACTTTPAYPRAAKTSDRRFTRHFLTRAYLPQKLEAAIRPQVVTSAAPQNGIAKKSRHPHHEAHQILYRDQPPQALQQRVAERQPRGRNA
jgi:uncharacterized protein (DUF433 family)